MTQQKAPTVRKVTATVLQSRKTLSYSEESIKMCKQTSRTEPTFRPDNNLLAEVKGFFQKNPSNWKTKRSLKLCRHYPRDACAEIKTSAHLPRNPTRSLPYELCYFRKKITKKITNIANPTLFPNSKAQYLFILTYFYACNFQSNLDSIFVQISVRMHSAHARQVIWTKRHVYISRGPPDVAPSFRDVV